MVSSDESPKSPRPIPPRLPWRPVVGTWAIIGTLATVVFLAPLSGIVSALVLTAVALVSYEVGKATGVYNQALRDFRLQDLCWRLRNVEELIPVLEYSLREGQPIHDHDDPATWEAERRSRIADAKRTIIDLRQQLQAEIQGGRGATIAI
jgi:hypothetical protein